MAFVFKLPDVGEGMAEGEIVQWYVSVGDTIQEDEPLLELQNDKLAQDIPSPVTGTVSKILVEVGTVASVGDPLIEIEEEGGSDSATDEPADSDAKNGKSTDDGTADEAVSQEKAAKEESDLIWDDKTESAKGEKKPDAKESGQAIDSSDSETGAAGKTYENNTVAGRVLAMPSVRQKARELGVDITKVNATGKHGHVILADLEKGEAKPTLTGETGEATPKSKDEDQAAAKKDDSAGKESSATKPTSSTTALGEEEREKMSVTRRAISQAMTKSAYTAPHVAIFDEVEVSKLVDHRKRFKETAAEKGVKLTYLSYIVKALVATAKKYPALNAMIDEKKEELVFKKYYNIGIAVDTERGLYVPNIKNADTKSMYQVADEITEKAKAAHDGNLASADMRGGTITISNIGSAGGMWFTPIINFPEVAILGIGRIDKKAIVGQDGELTVGQMLSLSLSFDHRIIDGMTAQLAMNELKRLLADPEALLMEG